MIDTVNGQTRIRRWPRKRGAPKSPAQRESRDKFRAAQLAAKFLSPTMFATITMARAGTPILPRDIVTAMLFGRLLSVRTLSGKEIWPMPALVDVSSALDVITQTPGRSLRRGETYWEAYIPSSGGGGSWTEVLNEVILSPTASIDIAGLADFSEVQIVVRNITKSVAGAPIVRASTDGGATYWNTSGDYVLVAAPGTLTNGSGATIHANNVTTARSGTMTWSLAPAGGISTAQSHNQGIAYQFVASTAKITDLQMTNTAGGNFTGGQVVVLAR